MPSYGNIRDWNPDTLNAAAAQLDRRINDLAHHQDDLDMARTPSGWTGEAANSASASGQRLLDRIEDLITTIAAVRRAIDDTADRVTSLKQHVAEADSIARYHGFHIADNGHIISMHELFLEELLLAKVKTDLQDRVKKIRDEAEDIDTHLANILQRAADRKINAGESKNSVEAKTAGDVYQLDRTGGTFVSGVEFVGSGEDGMRSLRVYPTLLSRVEGFMTNPALLLVNNANDLRIMAIAEKVTPLGLGSPAFGAWDAWNSWNEVKAHAKRIGLDEKVYDTNSMFQQFLCHWIGATKWPGEEGMLKESWNLEPARPEIGTLECARQKANPPIPPK